MLAGGGTALACVWAVAQIAFAVLTSSPRESVLLDEPPQAAKVVAAAPAAISTLSFWFVIAGRSSGLGRQTTGPKSGTTSSGPRLEAVGGPEDACLRAAGPRSVSVPRRRRRARPGRSARRHR